MIVDYLSKCRRAFAAETYLQGRESATRLELRETMSLPSPPKFFMIPFVQVKPLFTDGGSVRFGLLT